MDVATTIRQRLEAALRPRRVELVDESERHAGHAGWRPGGATHFRLAVVSDAFSGKSRLERQRMVYAALGDLMRSQIHALAVQARTPEEAGEDRS